MRWTRGLAMALGLAWLAASVEAGGELRITNLGVPLSDGAFSAPATVQISDGRIASIDAAPGGQQVPASAVYLLALVRRLLIAGTEVHTPPPGRAARRRGSNSGQSWRAPKSLR